MHARLYSFTLWSMWAAYLEAVSGEDTQTDIANRLGIAQSTVSRWLDGRTVPTNSAVVAKFAQVYGRNPIEAMVAAGMLDLITAGAALTDDDRKFLRRVGATNRSRSDAAATKRLRGRRRRP